MNLHPGRLRQRGTAGYIQTGLDPVRPGWQIAIAPGMQLYNISPNFSSSGDLFFFCLNE